MGSERVRLIVLIALFAISFAVARGATQFRKQQRHLPDWSAVPYQFDGWIGTDAQFDYIYAVDPADTSLVRVYREGNGLPVSVYIGFYSDLATILDVHTPELCYPAQGWIILSSRTSPAGVYRGRRITEKEALMGKDGDRRLVVWWYNAGSRPLENRIRYVYTMLAMSTFTGRTDGSMIRMDTPVENGNEAAAYKRIEEFRKSFNLFLDRALPH